MRSRPHASRRAPLRDPAGCVEDFCSNAVASPNDCGQCGFPCPGVTQSTDTVSCDAPFTCSFSCNGENYDVDGNQQNGCEDLDSPTGNHEEASAFDEGTVSDCEVGNTDINISGTLLSDTWQHLNPSINGWDAYSGSAPDWMSITGEGHPLCNNDLVLTFTTTGAFLPDCYTFTVITNSQTYSCTPDSSGTCGISHLSNQFSDNTIIYFEVNKTCGDNITEKVGYTITGHL